MLGPRPVKSWADLAVQGVVETFFQGSATGL